MGAASRVRAGGRGQEALRRLAALVALGLPLCCVPALLGAQERSRGPAAVVRGSVYDSAGAPIPDARVAVLGGTRVAVTSSRGEFVLDRMERVPTALRVRRLGYLARTVVLEPAMDTVDLSIELTLLPATLAPVVVEAMEERYTARMADFAERLRHAPRSSIMTRADIERRNPLRTSDLFLLLRTHRCQSPEIFIDGNHAPNFKVDWINPAEIEAIEYYRGAAAMPARFNMTLPSGKAPACAALIWTR